MSPQEQHLSCPQLSAVIAAEIARLKTLPKAAKTQQEQPSPSLSNLLTRWTGPKGAGLPATEDYRTSKERLLALNDLSWERGCGRADIEDELRDTEEIMRQGKWS